MSASRRAKGQRLPTEIICKIFEYAIDKHAWLVQPLTRINSALRSMLAQRLFQQLHLNSMEKLGALSVQRWVQSINPNEESARLALYLHFLNRLDDEMIFYRELGLEIQNVPERLREQVTTLGLRTFSGSQQHASLGLWVCNVMPNVKHLIVDSSMLAPFGAGRDPEEILAQMEKRSFPQRSARDCGEEILPPFDLSNGPSSVEVYAFVGSGLKGYFGHLGGLYKQRQYIERTFVNLKRLYLFTTPWAVDGRDMEAQIAQVILDFDAVTDVQLIVNVVVQGAEPRHWCPVEASVGEGPNGTLVLQNIEVDQPTDPQDMLALMHHIVDDIEAEWAPEEFGGYRWPPSVRPRYTTAIPTRYTLRNAGVKLPRRMV